MHELECALSCSCPVAAHPPPFHRHFSKNIAENWWLFFRNCWEEISLKQPAKSALTESAASRLPSIKSPPSTAGAKTLRFEKAWFMEDQARGGGEGGWEIMPECPTATFFSNGSRLNLARYVAYIFFFFAKAMLTRWMASCCMFGDRKDKSCHCRAAHNGMPPIWNVSSSWQGILSFSYVEWMTTMCDDYHGSGTQWWHRKALLLSVFIMHTEREP